MALLGAVLVLDQAAGGRLPWRGGELAAGVGDVEVDVGVGALPGDGELEDAGVQATALVDDPVAVVVAGIEAQLHAGGGAGGVELDARWRLDVLDVERALGRRRRDLEAAAEEDGQQATRAEADGHLERSSTGERRRTGRAVDGRGGARVAPALAPRIEVEEGGPSGGQHAGADPQPDAGVAQGVGAVGVLVDDRAIEEALAREKAMKKWTRAWKIDLIERINPDWLDLYDTIV